MPFKNTDMDAERRKLNEIIESSDEARKAKENFDAEYEFRLCLAKERKSKSITQKMLRNKSGLTQQTISRIENGSCTDRSPTLKTTFRYLNALGCKLIITNK